MIDLPHNPEPKQTFHELGKMTSGETGEPKTGSPDQELNRQYRTAMHSLEEIHKQRLVDAVARGMNPDGTWTPRKNTVTGCGCIIWTLIMLMVGFTVAASMSWIFNHSTVQAVLHGLLGWIYVCYKAFWYVVTNF